jgi:lipopolysaccharide/colanic/teichoic acid biosynthesis glycosyltransferase
MNERPFILIKFRSMVENAEKETGPKWAGENDLRITPVGKILRKTRLDELPQLFNVLRGEMSVVGPRPIRKHFADILAQDIPYYHLRFAVKPGITGWAQVCGDYAGSYEGQREKFKYDLYYIQNQSILFDLLILLKTVKTVLLRKGQ